MGYKDKKLEHEYNKQYWAKNKKQILAKRAQRKEENAEYLREWRDKNRERFNAYQRAYQKRKRQEAKQEKVADAKEI